MVYIPQTPKAAGKRPRKSKYGNKRVEYMGKMFDSIGERDRYIFLKDCERRGEIRNLRCQVSFDLEVNGVLICRYIADFVYELCDDEIPGTLMNKTVVEDYKGMKTPIYKLKEKLMLACHDIEIRVVKLPTLPI